MNCEPSDWNSCIKIHRCAYPCEQHCEVIETQRKTLETPRPKSNTEGSSIQRDNEGCYRDEHDAQGGYHGETWFI